MKVYRIYKIVIDFEWDCYDDDCVIVNKDETIKYVDSKDKVDEFFKDIEYKNDKARICYDCPILKLTKRKYNNHKGEIDDYCNNKGLIFNGNSISCENELRMDMTEYGYNEIEVE